MLGPGRQLPGTSLKIRTFCRRAADAVAEGICPLGIDEVGCGKFLSRAFKGLRARAWPAASLDSLLLEYYNLELQLKTDLEKLLATATMLAILRRSVCQSGNPGPASNKSIRSKVHWSSAQKHQ